MHTASDKTFSSWCLTTRNFWASADNGSGLKLRVFAILSSGSTQQIRWFVGLSTSPLYFCSFRICNKNSYMHLFPSAKFSVKWTTFMYVLIFTKSKLRLKLLCDVTGLQFAEQKDNTAPGITLLKKFFRETWMWENKTKFGKSTKFWNIVYVISVMRPATSHVRVKKADFLSLRSFPAL